MRSLAIVYTFGILLVSTSCLGILDRKNSGRGNDLFILLGLASAGGSYSPGASVDMDGDWEFDGVTVDEDGNGVSDGVDFDGDGIADLGLIDTNTDGIPDGVDVDRDGVLDYYICTQDGHNTIRTAAGCTGDEVTLIDSNDDEKPDGLDTDGNGVINDNTLGQIQNDLTIPTIAVNIPGGTFGSSQSITITCTDNVAPGTIGYTTNGDDIVFTSTGNFSGPPSKTLTVGSGGDGSYTLKFRCRDAKGNASAQGSQTYVVDSNVPAITINTAPLSHISNSAGAIGSTSIKWQSDRAGDYTVYRDSTSCGGGTSISSGSLTATQEITTNISASTHYTGEGSKSFVICVTDSVNSLVGSQVFSATRDDSAPTMTLNPGSNSYSSIQNVTASCSDTGGATCDKVAYTSNVGSAPANPAITGTTGAITSGTLYSGSLTPSNDAVNYYKFIARDKAGNVSTVQSQTVTIATNAATITIDSHSAIVSTGNGTLSWQSDRPGTYEIRLGATSCSNGSVATGTNTSGSVSANTSVNSTITAGLTTGENTIRICVSNLIGTQSFETITITKDTTSPTVTISNPSNAGPHTSGTTMTLTCTDTGGTGCQKIAYTTNGDDPDFSGADCSIGTGTQYSSAVTLSNGSYTIKARSCDNAGNKSTVASRAVIVGPPNTPSITTAAAGNGQVSITFSAVSEATSYKVYYKASSSGVTTSNSSVSGSSSPIVVSSLTNGTTYYFAMTAIHAGGESSLSGEKNATPTPVTIVNETGADSEMDYCVIQHPPTITLLANGVGSWIVYGRVYEAGITDVAGASSAISAQLGYGPSGTNPVTDSGWTFVDTEFNIQDGNNDEYWSHANAPSTPGTYSYVYRFSKDGTNYTYCDTNGAGSNSGLTFETAQMGTATVVNE